MDTRTFPSLPNGAQIGEFVDEAVAAALIHRPKSTLTRWRHERRYLPYHRHGGAIRYKVSDLLAFVEGQRVEPGRAA